MKLFNFDDFNFRGSDSLPGKFRGVAIAPNSEVDVCRIGSNLLTPQVIVPHDTTVQAVRGYRTGTLQGAPATRLGGRLTLACYEDCDPLVPLGPRANAFASRFADQAFFSPGSGLALRLPFAGRSQAVVAVRGQNTPQTQTITLVIRGVRYLPLDVIRTMAALGLVTNECYYDETVISLAPQASTVDAASPQNINTIRYVGGCGDNQEQFDELEVWVSVPVPVGHWQIDAEASGERGLR